MRTWLQLKVVLKTMVLLDPEVFIDFNHLLRFITVSYFMKQRKQKSVGIPPESENLSLVSEKDLKVELFLAYLMSSPLMKAFLLLQGWNDSKGIYRYLLRGFWKVENCSTLTELSLYRNKSRNEMLLSLIENVSLIRLLFLLRAPKNSRRISLGPPR